MKNIKAFTILSLVMLLPLQAKAQVTDWIVNQIVEQVVGNIVDNIAESAGRSAVSSTVGLYSNTTSKTSTNFTNYKSNIGSRSRGEAFLGMNGNQSSYKTSLADTDVNNIYKGFYTDNNIQQTIQEWTENNKKTNSTLTDLSKNRDKYIQLFNLRKLIGDKSYSVWLNQPKANQNISKIVNDLSCNVRLLNLLSSQPLSVKSYVNLMDSPLRRDPAFLYYISRQADCFEHIWDSLCSKTPHISARDMTAEYKLLYTYLLTGDEKECAIVDKIKSGKYDITCVDPAFLDLYPMGNASIHYDNIIWQTDNLGRPIKVTLSITSLPKAAKKDKHKSDFLTNLKLNYAALGVPEKQEQNKKYVDFNLVPLAYGNYCNILNVFPLTKSAAKNSDLKKIDKNIQKTVKKGFQATRVVLIDYGSNNSLVPETISIQASIGEKVESCKITNN